jgi:hypothetical protein
LPRIVVPHPIGGTTPEVAVEKARDAWPGLAEWLKQVTAPQPE